MHQICTRLQSRALASPGKRAAAGPTANDMHLIYGISRKDPIATVNRLCWRILSKVPVAAKKKKLMGGWRVEQILVGG